ncbi:hypothetical protein CDEST_13066 [Colletotrichum destructivum]|uniref:DUF7908 domain-containing protein n=1 Tax=Colletotrichum destructivum TaxID=34406 RepID=A0AAX4IY70_9PEZI|nr:hypothetical protein CDEST_13066 [Colletotrichum destructivum]
MRPQSLASSLIVLQAIASVVSRPYSDDSEAVCFTYFSTYLEPIFSSVCLNTPTSPVATTAESSTNLSGSVSETDSVSSNPSFPVSKFTIRTDVSGTTFSTDPASSPPSSFSSISVSGPPSSFFTTSTPGISTSASTAQFSVTGSSSSPSPSVFVPATQPLIFLVVPGPTIFKRILRKRIIEGFVVQNTNEDRQDCNSAKRFDLISEQLLIDGEPVYYSGEDYKLLNAGGSQPVGSVTTTFSVSTGILQFSNPILPGNQASFCQDRNSQVYITFASRPPDCDPVSLLAYTVEQCQNGQILVPSSSSQDSSGSSAANLSDTGLSSRPISDFTTSASSLVPQESSTSTRTTSAISSTTLGSVTAPSPLPSLSSSSSSIQSASPSSSSSSLSSSFSPSSVLFSSSSTTGSLTQAPTPTSSFSPVSTSSPSITTSSSSSSATSSSLSSSPTTISSSTLATSSSSSTTESSSSLSVESTSTYTTSTSSSTTSSTTTSSTSSSTTSTDPEPTFCGTGRAIMKRAKAYQERNPTSQLPETIESFFLWIQPRKKLDFWLQKLKS